MYHNIRAIEAWHKLSNTIFVSGLEISPSVESVEHDFVPDVEFDFFASVFVCVVCLVDFCPDEIVVCLCGVIVELFNDLGCID